MRVQQVSQPRVLRQSDVSSDELPSRRRARQGVQRLEPSPDQLRGHASRHRASQQPSREQQAPRHPQQASRPQP